MSENVVEYKTESVETQAIEVSKQALALKVYDRNTYAAAGEMLKNFKIMKVSINDFFSGIKKDAYDSWKGICAKENEAIKPIDAADKYLRSEINGYLEEQERIRLAVQRKAEEEARAAAEKEKAKLLEQAVKAEESGKIGKAEALIEKAEAVYQAPVIVPATVQKTVRLENGSVTRKTDIEVIVTDPATFVKSIAAGHVPLTVLDFRLGTIKQWVKTSGIKPGTIPGLLIRETQSVSVR